MSERKAPVVASWLLGKCSVNPALVGDIDEEFSRGRQAAWYWKQTAVAVIRCGHVLPGTGATFLAAWVLQLPVVYALWRYSSPSLIPFVIAGLALVAAQHYGRRYLVGSRYPWKKVPSLLNDANGPYTAFGVPLWAYVLCDEVTDYLVTYLFLTAAIGRFQLSALILCEVAWFAAHFLIYRRRVNRA